MLAVTNHGLHNAFPLSPIYSSHALYIHNVSKSNQVVNRSLTPCQSASLSLKTSRKDTEKRSVYSYSTFVEPAVCEPKPKLGLTLKLEPGLIVQKCTWRHIEHNGGSPRDTHCRERYVVKPGSHNFSVSVRPVPSSSVFVPSCY